MDFWDVHGTLRGIALCAFCAFLPRLSLTALVVFAGAIGVTFWGFLGYIFAPRITIAFIATALYGSTNVFLCLAAWACALCGEVAEKRCCYKCMN